MLRTIKTNIQKGFTLIELMIVVAIIGILAAIAIPQYTGFITSAQITEAFSLMKGAAGPMSTAFTSDPATCIDNDTAALTSNGMAVDTDITGRYVQQVRLRGTPAAAVATGVQGTAGCSITATFWNTTAAAAGIRGLSVTMVLVQNAGALHLECLRNGSTAFAFPAGAVTSAGINRFLPTSCI